MVLTINSLQIRKRLYQLTGKLIPDAKLGASHTIRNLLTIAAGTEKPKTLRQTIRAETTLNRLPNVKVHGRRITPIDKEKAVGRWKIIEEELLKRGLPVTGSEGLPRHRERIWMTGKS